LISTPLREQRICHHCSMQAFEDEQCFLFDCPYQQSTDIKLLSSKTAISLVVLHTTCTHTCAFEPGCFGHNWLHTQNYKLLGKQVVVA